MEVNAAAEDAGDASFSTRICKQSPVGGYLGWCADLDACELARAEGLIQSTASHALPTRHGANSIVTEMADFVGAPDTIRTCDLCLRRAVIRGFTVVTLVYQCLI